MRKKMIEVAIPLDAINKESAREKSIRHGHPSTLHLWWSRKPLATARAILFTQLVDDPSSWPELFPTEDEQNAERIRLFQIVESLVRWESTRDPGVFRDAYAEILKSWNRTCAHEPIPPEHAHLFDPTKLPGFYDPFAGGGSLPLEAHRLGLSTAASDLNPVAVLVSKALIEFPAYFANTPSVNPVDRKKAVLSTAATDGASGLAADVRFYGTQMREIAEAKLGRLYPQVTIDADMAAFRPDLERYVGRSLTVIAWVWCRTVPSPNPAFKNVDVPLTSSFWLATKPGKEAYVATVLKRGGFEFEVRCGMPSDADAIKRGTQSGKGGTSFLCLMSGAAMPFEYLRERAKAGDMRSRLMAIVAEGDRERVYLTPTAAHEALARSAAASDLPETELPAKALGFRVQEYGIRKWTDLFTERQLCALTCFSDLVEEISRRVAADAKHAGLPADGKGLADGGRGATAYAEAIAVYLALAIDKSAVYWNNICPWLNQPKNEIVGNSFSRQTVSMVWSYAEANPLSDSGGNFGKQVDYVSKALQFAPANQPPGEVSQADAATQSLGDGRVISTDPPYYDNIGYADLSDFFYVWLRRTLFKSYPKLFATMTVPKAGELVAFAARHGGKKGAEEFFLSGMTKVMQRLAQQSHPAFPATIYYAFKQAESDSELGTVSTGWETFLDAVLQAGFAITGTWPTRTERPGRLRETGSNALASSIVLVCRRRVESAPIASRRDFLTQLKGELPEALRKLQAGNIAPVDLAQAAIGPGMAVYSRYSKVLESSGERLTVRTALALINQVLDEVLAEQEGDYDADTRWSLKWFEQFAQEDGPFGDANTLATAMSIGINGLVETGIVHAKSGKVRLLRRAELMSGHPETWDPATDTDIVHWEVCQYLIHSLDTTGEAGAAALLRRINARYPGAAETARELAYRLYTICERKKWAQEAIAYNSLIVAWPEIVKLAQSSDGSGVEAQTTMF